MQNDNMFQGQESVTDTDLHLIPLYVLGAICHNKRMLLWCFVFSIFLQKEMITIAIILNFIVQVGHAFFNLNKL